MSGLENTLFQLKFTAKQLNKQSRKATKDKETEERKLKKAIEQGNNDGARIYASNAIRKKNESLNLLRLASRVDAVCSQVETAVTMRKVTGNMASVTKQMDRAMASMNLEKISMVMEQFEGQFEDMNVQSSYMEGAMGSSSVTDTPQDQVDSLMAKVADEAGLEQEHAIKSPAADSVPELKEQTPAKEVEEDALAKRLRALRPQTS